jgi:hypothetical protein
MWIAWIKPQVVVPKYFGNVGHTHGHARMTGGSALYRVHRQGAHCIGEQAPGRSLGGR